MNFLAFFNATVCRVKIIEKKKSPLMWIIAGILWLSNLFRITHTDPFLSSYITTLHNRIYWPGPLNNAAQPSTGLLHELTHVMEWKLRGLRYDFEYIFNTSKRAYYESVCVQTEMLLDPKRQNHAHVSSRIPQFVKYGIPSYIIHNELAKRLAEIQTPQIEAKTVVDAFNDWAKETS